jgi:phosphoenolpyruvate-protein phosphotransferase
MILRGQGISPGYFEGRAHVLDASAWIRAAAAITPRRGPERERERLRAAQARACAQLERVQSQLFHQGRKEDAEIFAAHAAMMRDPALLRRVEKGIIEDGLSAEAAVASATTLLDAEFEASPLDMVRDKAADVVDIGHRLLRCLDPQAEARAVHGEPRVLVAETLTPSELVRFAHRGPCAALTETCGSKSHVAILARSLGIPFLTGVASPLARVAEDALVLLDTEQGLALVDPGGEELEAAGRIRNALARALREPPTPRQPVTRDGIRIHLALNISDPREGGLVTQLGASGVGLFRTEFLYMDRKSWPSEEESFDAYSRLAAAIGDGELHIRLADFGADKCPDYADFPIGRNPSLGVRGVRLLLQRDDILAPQVRAIARLAERRPVALIVPMLDNRDTLERLVSRLEGLCEKRRGAFPFQLGAMIEVPAAALAISEILENVDLASIGLNDLTQYLMAADREDESVQSYHDALQPAVLRLIRQVISAADAAGKPVSVCGELAGDPALATALLALGLRRLSVSRPDYSRVLELTEGLSIAELEKRRDEILRARTSSEVRRILEALEPALAGQGANP